MAKKASVNIEFLGGIREFTKEKSGLLVVSDEGLKLVMGFSSSKCFLIPWNLVLSLKTIGDTNPAFQTVASSAYGIPGIQSIGNKRVRTGAKCFLSIDYERYFNIGNKKWSDNAGTVQVYVIDKNQTDVELILAPYMSIVEQTARSRESARQQALAKKNEAVLRAERAREAERAKLQERKLREDEQRIRNAEKKRAAEQKEKDRILRKKEREKLAAQKKKEAERKQLASLKKLEKEKIARQNKNTREVPQGKSTIKGTTGPKPPEKGLRKPAGRGASTLTGRDLAAALKDVGVMYKAGLLTDQEFETAKKKLLS